jgi:hypothetical protein
VFNILVLVFFSLISFCSISQTQECKFPDVAKGRVVKTSLIGTWHYQLSNGLEKETKTCDFKADGWYSCEITEQGPIDEKGKVLEAHHHTESGRWIVWDDNKLTKESVFTIVNLSPYAFKIKNSTGYSELYYKNKECVSTL